VKAEFNYSAEFVGVTDKLPDNYSARLGEIGGGWNRIGGYETIFYLLAFAHPYCSTLGTFFNMGTLLMEMIAVFWSMEPTIQLVTLCPTTCSALLLGRFYLLVGLRQE